MSAFSRGLFFRPQCTFKAPRNVYLFYQVRSALQPRSFSTSAILRAAKRKLQQPQNSIKSNSNSKTQSSPLAKVATGLHKPSYQTYASKLAEKGQPTLIYVAPSHTSFLVASYTAAAFCFAYSTYNMWTLYIYPPPGLAAWVPTAFGVVCIGMSAMGTWLMLSPSRIIRTITAIPISAARTATVAKSPVPNKVPTEIELEIVLRKMLPIPFVKPRTFRVKPEALVIRSPLVAPPARNVSPAERMAMVQREEAERKKALEYEQTHIMSAPFRHMSRAFFSLFKATARTWTREGFAKLKANGQTYKLDVTGGWALDGGKAIDRLVTLKPEIS
jgi:hypothetical protein